MWKVSDTDLVTVVQFLMYAQIVASPSPVPLKQMFALFDIFGMLQVNYFSWKIHTAILNAISADQDALDMKFMPPEI